MFWCNSKIKQDSKMYKKMNRERFALEENPSKRKEVDKKIREIDEFVENIYARDVFDKYNKKKPDLVRNKTGEVVPWDTAFGTDFSEVPSSLRHSLVGLIEGSGRYRFK